MRMNLKTHAHESFKSCASIDELMRMSFHNHNNCLKIFSRISVDVTIFHNLVLQNKTRLTLK